MSARRVGWASTLAAAALLAAAPAATAKVVRLTGDASAGRAEIAVDASGTAHVVWDRRVGSAHTLVYCRVPRGAGACAATRSFALPGVDGALGAAHVTVMPRGELVLTTARSFDTERLNPGTRVYAIVSGDGGASFLEPRVIGEYATHLQELVSVAAGPGDFSLSLGFSEGTYSAASLDALTTTLAGLGAPQRELAVGFTDPTSPVVAYADDGIQFRLWQGPSDYNDAARWSPLDRADRGTAPLLASGPRGLYLVNEDRGASGRKPSRLLVRRFEPAGNTFGRPRTVSDKPPAFIQFGDFHQDAKGTLHVVFSEGATGRRRLSRRASVDGVTWGPTQVVATGVRTAIRARIGAAPDGSGAVVFADAGISFAPFGAAGSGGDGTCPPSVTVGVVVIRALEGCLRRDGSRYTTAGAVKVNGVDVEGGSGLSSVTVDTEARTLKTRGEATVRVGGVTLDRGPISWQLPAGEGRLQRLGVADGSVFPDLARFAKTLFSFPVKGDAELRVAKGAQALIDTDFQLPALLGGVTGAVTLRTTDQRGLVLDGFKIKVPAARIGKLRIAEVEVVYESDPDVFNGTAKVQLPPAYGPPVTVGFGFRQGRVNLIHADKRFDPTLPIVGVAPQPVVGLDMLAFDYLNTAGSRTFQGSVDLQGGPAIAGFRVSELEGKVTLTFPPEPKPAAIDATGKLKVVGIPFATGHVRYSTDNLFTFDGTLQFPPAGKWDGFAKVSASVAGFVSLSKPYPFSATGDATATIAGVSGSGQAVISTKGVTGCVSFHEIPNPVPGLPDIGLPDLGVSYRWGDAYPVPVCNVGDFKLQAPGSARAAQAARSISIPGRLRQAVIAIAGQGGPPTVRLTAPSGEQVVTGSEPRAAGRFVAQQVGEAATTYVSIGAPPAGRYTIEPETGSPPIKSVGLATALPAPSVTAKLTGTGRARSLSYRIRRIPGQRVTFAEQSARGLFRAFASTGRASGRIRFQPTSSSARERRIVALVEQNGYPRAKLELARLTAPPPRTLAPPRRVRIRRRGSTLIVSWTNVRRARGYEVRISMPRDGRRLLRTTKPTRRHLAITGLERNDTGTVTVRAIDDEADLGKARTVRLRR